MDGTDDFIVKTKAWANATAKAISADMVAKGVVHSKYSLSKKALTDSIAGRVRLQAGLPQRVSIIFPRHLVFVRYGVGKNRPKGSGKEHPKQIVDNVLAANINQLADIAANGYADIVVKNLFINKTGL